MEGSVGPGIHDERSAELRNPTAACVPVPTRFPALFAVARSIEGSHDAAVATEQEPSALGRGLAGTRASGLV
jgi:hypothetical protein